MGSVLTARSAQAIGVDQVAIDRGVGQPSGVGSWYVEISVVGTDLAGGVLSSPTGFDITLNPVSGSTQLFGSASFANLADLNAAFPLGTWSLDLNDGELAGDIAYDSPVPPDGSAPISSPVQGAVDVGLLPTMSFLDQCTNCQVYSGGSPVDGMGMPFPDTMLVGRLHDLDLGEQIETIVLDPSATETGFMDPLLPNTNYRFETSVATQNYTPTSIGSESFDYFQVSSQTESTDFGTVPEPGTAVLLASGLLLMAARRRTLRA